MPHPEILRYAPESIMSLTKLTTKDENVIPALSLNPELEVWLGSLDSRRSLPRTAIRGGNDKVAIFIVITHAPLQGAPLSMEMLLDIPSFRT